MEYIKTSIPDVWILEPRVFEDARGYFMETWREVDFNNAIGQKYTLCKTISQCLHGVCSVVCTFKKVQTLKPN